MLTRQASHAPCRVGQRDPNPAERQGAALMLEVQIHRLDPELPLPSYAHADDAGADLMAAVDVTLPPGERVMVPTGVAVALPPGYAGFVHPRSGLAARCGLSIVNAPGTIDAGYRGEIKVVLVNLDPRQAVTLRRGDRIAQLVVQRVETVRFVETDGLDDTPRGAGGYGSTGGFSPHADAPEDTVLEGTADVSSP
jgi:dUTP pyrophosphatase